MITHLSWAFLAGLITAFGLVVGLSEVTPARPSAHVTVRSSQPAADDVNASRARYLSAADSLDRSWGDWNIAFHDPIDRRYFVIIGIDTRERCETVRRVISEHFKDREGVFNRDVAKCFETIASTEVRR